MVTIGFNCDADGDNGKTHFSFEGNTIAEAMVDCINGIMDIYEDRKEKENEDK